MNGTKLYSTAAVSRDGGRVEVDGAEPDSLAIVQPAELGGSGGGWDPERLYAAALATCLHQSLVIVASSGGHDTSGSSVRAEVTLGESGAEAYDLRARLVVALPNVDTDDRRQLVDQAVGHCPLAGGWDVSLA
ncbi:MULTISPECIES: OsmC family protein [Actinokineospora]|uniref:Osmotically inducible protein C n=1 Tax=Actinokineospora fastidiosa TaxID=1816 RepID=A0A918LJ26_9PSEU|nr:MULTISPECIES: OsmC family protein [Actinokineospora]UVS78482.1 peroxiredoxin, Ohr subfamily [Actinokineospora sp. UTMC 2448]GGS55113.1 osmotically inducible protein C [Actinokineospora fastidiosa]